MDYTNGFTGTEIVERVRRYIGNLSADFKSYIENTLPIAESRFCTFHDWSFLRKVGLDLPVVYGTANYTLSAGAIGFNMTASNVETIYSPDKGFVLRNVDMTQMRRYDPEEDDGTPTDTPTWWARTGDNTIKIWPPKFAGLTLKLDGKISPPDTGHDLTTLSNYPTIPFRYQESFIEYVTGIALDREDDTRAPNKKAEAMALLKMDIADDLRNLGQTMNDRMKSMAEASTDGQYGNIDAYLWGLWDD